MHAAIDRVIFETANVRVGAFRCAAQNPHFRDSGPAEAHLVVFPRTAVWIRHAGSRAFLADPGIATIYNRGQEYTRAAESPDGDRSDWFAVSPEVACAIAHDLAGRSDIDPERPYHAAWVPSDLRMYWRQRALFQRLLSDPASVDVLETEESVLEIVGDIVSRGHGVRRQSPSREREAHRDLAQRARAELARDVAAHTSVSQLAQRLDVSPYHLCRVFRAVTGVTLHAYRLDLRCRMALERLAERGADLSRVALELGFSSHSHFTAALRRRFGITPSQLRRTMNA